MKFDAHLDEITQEGRITGWACRQGRVEQLHIGIFHEETLIAETVAQDYRPGLLAAGYGLGHCQFTARMAQRPPAGEQELELRLMSWTGSRLRFSVQVPPVKNTRSAAPPIARCCWSDADLLANVEQLRLSEQVKALGLPRFVERLYQFVLGRWPEEKVFENVAETAARGEFDAEDYFTGLMCSHERRQKSSEPLPSPFDYRFPFRYPVKADDA